MKQTRQRFDRGNICGRPFTGAWIETVLPQRWKCCGRVAPSRGRGLKLLARKAGENVMVVAPSRGRGLKLE